MDWAIGLLESYRDKLQQVQDIGCPGLSEDEPSSAEFFADVVPTVTAMAAALGFDKVDRVECEEEEEGGVYFSGRFPEHRIRFDMPIWCSDDVIADIFTKTFPNYVDTADTTATELRVAFNRPVNEVRQAFGFAPTTVPSQRQAKRQQIERLRDELRQAQTDLEVLETWPATDS